MKSSNEMKQHSAVELRKNCLKIIMTLCCIIDFSTTFTQSKPVQIDSGTPSNDQPQIHNPLQIQTQKASSNIEYQYNKQVDPFMQLHKLSKSNSITCNDGSDIGYYKRLNSHSKSWIIYLQGGGFCASEDSCNQRWRKTPQLMSSNYWPKTKTGKL